MVLFVIIAVALIHIFSMLTVDRTLAYTEIEYSSEKVSGELNGYTIAFVTDTHAISAEKLETVVEHINSRKVDLLLLGGDYAPKQGAWRSLEILAKAQTQNGIYGVDGNHDKWVNIKAAMEAYGITPLDNNGVALQNGLYVAGVADLYNRKPDVTQAVAQAKPEDFVLLVSHNPDVSMKQDMAGVGLMLSGHTHGGHVTLFGVWKPFLYAVSDYGHRFGKGWATGNNGVDVFVSRGVGSAKFAPRVFAQPEVVYVTLKGPA